MTHVLGLRAGACGVLLGIVMVSIGGPAQADAMASPPLATPAKRASIDQAIEDEKSRRSGAITGMVIGAVVAAAGSAVSAVASVDNQNNKNNKNNGSPTRHNVWIGDAIGLGVGLPIIGISAYFFADAQHRLNLLRSQRLSVSYAPDTHQPVLQLSFNY